nr:cell filamentation protein Fic [Desulfobulbaceae bacterium]
MATIRKNPQKALAESLKAARKVSQDGIINSSLLKRKHREILTDAGWLVEIIKGWYVLSAPEAVGNTAWYGVFWGFIKQYLIGRFGEDGFCVSPEASLNLHAGDTTIPEQIVVHTKKASNTTVLLPHGSSLLLITDVKNFPKQLEVWNGVTIMPLPLALCRIPPAYYRKNPRNIEIVLKLSSLSIAAISRCTLGTEAISAAERIIGAYEYFGEKANSDQIKNDLIAAGYHLEVKNPFEEYAPVLGSLRSASPYAGRIRMMWFSMRERVLAIMPREPGLKSGAENRLGDIQEIYQEDAYHSLSIEGY